MNSTERLLACLRGEMPDRVPISTYELVGWNRRAWENRSPSYARLMELVRQETDCLYMTDVHVPNARAKDHQAKVEQWTEGEQHVTRTVVHSAGRTLTTITSRSDKLMTVWTREHPVKDLDDLRAWLALPWEPGQPDFRALKQAWDDLAGTRGLAMISISDPLCELAEAFEFGNFLVHAITETPAMLAAMDQLHERRIQTLQRILAGPVRNAVFRICGPEYATVPYLPPEMFQLFVTRYDGQYIRMIQQAGGFARLHCHGKIARVLDQIIELAPDALDPLEPPPDGDITLAELKHALGDRMCLMGGLELRPLEMSLEDAFVELITEDEEAG